MKQAVEADETTDHLADDDAGLGRGVMRIEGCVDHMGAHRHRQVGQGAEGHEIVRGQANALGLDHGQVLVAIAGGATVTGNVLDHRKDPAFHQPFSHRPSESDDNVRIGAVGAIADDVMSSRHRHVEDGRAIDVDSHRGEIMRHEPRAEARHGGARSIEAAETGAGRIRRPVRRSHALHPSAFLVDQNRRIGPARRSAQRIGQRPHLVRRADIALEQDEAPGLRVAKERGLLVRESPGRHSRGSGRELSWDVLLGLMMDGLSEGHPSLHFTMAAPPALAVLERGRHGPATSRHCLSPSSRHSPERRRDPQFSSLSSWRRNTGRRRPATRCRGWSPRPWPGVRRGRGRSSCR